MEIIHTPVMLNEVKQYLDISGLPSPLVIDGTMGEGGHSEMFLSEFPEAYVIGIDRDANIQKKAKERLAVYGNRVNYVNDWFDHFFANYSLERKADRILLDLGISVYHYVESDRGFSFGLDEPLDMRLNMDSNLKASDIVNEWDEESIANLIFKLGEERYSRSIARAIVKRRKISTITNSKELAEIIFTSVPVKYRHGRIHPATRTFQALRIQVNNELSRIETVVQDALTNLNIGGRLGIITFHSLEDRIVKNAFKFQAQKCVCPPEYPKCICSGKPAVKILTRKPVIPTEEEIKNNSPSRSAKFRVCEKVGATKYEQK
ncbi:16S rRNA (cytosine(1402)-N(4))-methyltransferase RsmH [Spirochaeta cellobiosiphila]|uniref:16S rRNA (cytosine(1402)-N(4))-methyltransferase RsmH n=1 Tax=Spirochaeta cellobiosiphila TaxID=504483 RepID=UPI00040D4062|nr:16S rRNA (cytosine(1402)-N(4))-methyltransferase RsmH [Spirochaeta cellobiosiphila]